MPIVRLAGGPEYVASEREAEALAEAQRCKAPVVIDEIQFDSQTVRTRVITPHGVIHVQWRKGMLDT